MTLRARLDQLQPRRWQAEALLAWSQTCQGVVEAVTGVGKTRLGMLAIRTVVARGGRALVLVPTLELQQQWCDELMRLLPEVRVGYLGGGGDHDLFDCQVLVATPHSAAAVPLELPPGAPGLVVADEAHRYGAPSWAKALSETFPMRLALTATYERADDGVAEVLEPYFGPVVYAYGYDRAARDGVIAPFSIGLVRVELTDTERAAHEAADTRVKHLHGLLIATFEMPREPRALFAAVAAVVADADAVGRDGPQVQACREYLVRVRERRDVAAGARAKLDVCDAVAPALDGRRSLVFTDTVAQAHDAAARLTARGVTARCLHGELPAQQRRADLARFRRGELAAIVAPRVLDEGVDVPDADVAVVLAAFRSRRHLIQRLGRVLRRKHDGREARLVLAYAQRTAEDPARGGHAGFLDQVREAARRVDDFTLSEDAAELTRWLARPGR